MPGPRRGVSAPGGGGCVVCLVWGGGVCSWGRGCGVPGPGGGVCSRGGGSGIPACTEADTLPPLLTESQTPVKTLPWPNFVAAGNNVSPSLSKNIWGKIATFPIVDICSKFIGEMTIPAHENLFSMIRKLMYTIFSWHRSSHRLFLPWNICSTASLRILLFRQTCACT